MPSIVEVVSGNSYKMKLNPADGYLRKLISFSPIKKRVFEIVIDIHGDEDRPTGQRVMVLIWVTSGPCTCLGYTEVSVTATAGSGTETIYHRPDNTYHGELDIRGPVDLEFKFKFPNKGMEPPTLADEFKTFIEEGKKITLLGSDGDVQVSKFLLKLRSPALKAMLQHDTKEKRDMKIDLKDFDQKTLKAFVHFLTTAELDDDGMSTALELYIFADMYLIEGLKDAASCYILNNMKQFDSEQVFEVFMKIEEPDFVKTNFGKFFETKLRELSSNSRS